MPFISEVGPIFIQRFYTGWITLRNQLTTPIKLMGRRVIELYDALIAGNDWEVTPSLSLKRRAGHTAYVTINAPAQNLYSWKSNTMGTIPIIDTTADVEYVNSSGTTTVMTTKPLFVQGQTSLLGIGNYLYAGNGSRVFKWDGPTGPQGVTGWGISSSAATNVIGPDNAGAGANNPAYGVGAWANPNNVTSAVSFCTVTVTAASNPSIILIAQSNPDDATTFGFSVGAQEKITGIQFTLNAFVDNAFAGASSLVVTLLKNGLPVGTSKSITLTSVNTSYTLGSASDLWGATWGPVDVNSTTFGIAIQGQVVNAFGSSPLVRNFSMNNVACSIFGVGGPSATPTGTGSFSAVNGYSYVVAYGNSASGEISNGSPVSANTGPFTNKAYVGIGVTASSDAQVNQIRVYRTTDSGGGNEFFEIGNSPFPNTTATVQDTTPDTGLQVTSQAEVNLGNTPPPVTLTNLEWFAGRMWGSANNLLFASTGPETISGTAPNSNWNPDFQWVIPGVVMRNVTGPNGMLVFTQDDCLIVRGTDITNYTVNEFVKDFGIRTYNAVDTDGTNIYVFTSDRQFIVLSSSGAQDLGLAIADQLANVDPTVVYVKVNRYGLDSIVRILDTANNVYYDYNLNQQCWNLPGILKMAACSAMGSIEVSPGVWRLLLSSTNSGVSKLAYRDITNFQDLGTSYSPVAVFGSIQLADPGTLAKIGALGGFCLQFTNAGIVPTLSVLPNDIGCTMSNAVGSQVTGQFVSLSVGRNPFPVPPTLGNQPVGYRSLGYYYMMAKGLSGFVQNLQFQLVAPAENTALELLGFGIFGDMKQETEQAGQLPQLQGR
jgi:hypothetical protein